MILFTYIVMMVALFISCFTINMTLRGFLQLMFTFMIMLLRNLLLYERIGKCHQQSLKWFKNYFYYTMSKNFFYYSSILLFRLEIPMCFQSLSYCCCYQLLIIQLFSNPISCKKICIILLK